MFVCSFQTIIALYTIYYPILFNLCLRFSIDYAVKNLSETIFVSC